VKYVWIVEMQQGLLWWPCACGHLTRKDALREIGQSWKKNFPDDKFRARKYVREKQ